MKELRALIYDVAAESDGVGELEECLKWGEPSFLTSQTKSGTTLRIGWKPDKPEHIGMYVSCNTNLISTFRSAFGDELTFEGNRAILLPAGDPFPEKELRICIQMTLRYHLDK